MSQQQSESVVTPSASDIGPISPFSSSSAVVRQDDGTVWIFYYAFGDIISYEKKPRNGKATRHQLTINGKLVIGSHTELAAALWQDSPRVYYITSNLELHEAALQGTSGDKWINGSLSNYKWKTSPLSSLAALGTRELAGDRGVFLQVYFNESVNPAQFTQASNTGVDKWEKALF